MSGAATDAARAGRRARARRIAGLYALTPELADTARLVDACAAAIAGGATVLQYRHKNASPALRRAQAEALAALCRRSGTLFIVNDDPALAAAVDADGVHLGEDDGGIAAARALLAPDRIVGVSCYDALPLARAAVDEGADYVAFGSFHPSPTKPEARRADPALLGAARALRVPVVAIGGITAANAGALFAAGAGAVSVISDLFDRPDAAAITAAARALAALAPASRANG